MDRRTPQDMKANGINIIFAVLAAVILMIRICYDVNYLDYKPPMRYDDWQQITWADFRGFKRPNYTLNGESRFAFITTSIELMEKPDGSRDVVTYFHPSRSYVYNKGILAKGLLTHELYHLHITEYVARLVRKSLRENFYTRSDDIAKLLAEMNDKERAMQLTYDSESYHGYRLQMQKEWEAYIDSCLLATKAYAHHTIDL